MGAVGRRRLSPRPPRGAGPGQGPEPRPRRRSGAGFGGPGGGREPDEASRRLDLRSPDGFPGPGQGAAGVGVGTGTRVGWRGGPGLKARRGPGVGCVSLRAGSAVGGAPPAASRRGACVRTEFSADRNRIIRLVVVEACARALALVHTLQRTPPSVAGPGRRGQELPGREWPKRQMPPPPPPPPSPPSPPGSCLARRLGGPGPSPASLWGLGAGHARDPRPGQSAERSAAGRERLVNDLISSLGRRSRDLQSLAPPPPWSAPRRGYNAAPCARRVLHQPPAGGVAARDRPAGRAGPEPSGGPEG